MECRLRRATHRQLGVSKQAEGGLEELREGRPPAAAGRESEVRVLLSHPARLGAQVPGWRCKRRHHIAHQHLLQLPLILRLHSHGPLVSRLNGPSCWACTGVDRLGYPPDTCQTCPGPECPKSLSLKMSCNAFKMILGVSKYQCSSVENILNLKND